MYEYYNGYVIREGNEGILANQLRQLYQDVGWVNLSPPQWQNEKFEFVMKNILHGHLQSGLEMN